MEDKVQITLKYYEYLIKRSAFLSRLEAAGVDNWEGYWYACDEEDDEEEEYD